ncbi:hypothetical protein FJ366_04175 [Candidatus Dependentiae bacterium]|nr:hypothetical protein [Candidatus Dependentiae bacterium]
MAFLLQKNNGSVLLIVLCFLSILGVLTQKLLKTTFLTVTQMKQQIKKDRAQIYALNGVFLALSQLNQQPQNSKEKKEGESEKSLLLETLLPLINKWQTFTLTQKLDGVDATIKIYISCEEGKIPVQGLTTQEKEKKPVKEFIPLIKQLSFNKKNAQNDISPKLFSLLANKEIMDATQLHQIIDYPFFISPASSEVKKRKNGYFQSPATTDIFTTWSKENKINPLFLSHECKKILSIKTPEYKTKGDKNEKDFYHQVALTISKEWGSDWNKNSQLLASLYKTEVSLPKEIQTVLTEAIEPEIFSVLSCGVVQGIEQRIYAVIRRNGRKPAQEPATEAKKNMDKNQDEKLKTVLSSDGEFGVLRTYWIDEFEKYEI